jgi:hypothetical protein
MRRPHQPGAQEPGAQEPGAQQRSPGLPVALRVAIWLLSVQATGLAGLSGYLVYRDLTAPAGTRAPAVAIIAMAILTGLLVAALARWLAQRRGAARGPAVVLELLMAAVGYTMATAGAPWLGASLIAMGVGGVIALVVPSTRDSLGVR